MEQNNTKNKYKRNVAYKLRVADILYGKPIYDGERFLYLDIDGKKISRVNIIGNIVDKYETEKFIFFTIDDGSEQIKLKAFTDLELFKGIDLGNTVIVIGVLRSFNKEIYVSPEIMKIQDPKYLLVRKMEMDKFGPKPNKEAKSGMREKIIQILKDSGEIELEDIKKKMPETHPEIIKKEIKGLIEGGVIFELRPERYGYLG